MVFKRHEGFALSFAAQQTDDRERAVSSRPQNLHKGRHSRVGEDNRQSTRLHDVTGLQSVIFYSETIDFFVTGRPVEFLFCSNVTLL